LLADAESIADFLGVPRSRVPAQPETLDNPKLTVVNLARVSRRNKIRDDMVPREGSGRNIGAAYTSRLVEFTSSSWRPEIAEQRSDSLRRTLGRLRELVGLP